MYSPVPRLSASAVVRAIPSRVVFSGGLSGQYRTVFVTGFLVVSIGSLVVLAYKLRARDSKAGETGDVLTKLEPTESRESDISNSKLAWVADIVYSPKIYFFIVSAPLGMGLFFTAIGRFSDVAAALIFGSGLFSIKAFLRFGWPYFERFYERRTPDQQDPDSLRFQGFSTDTSLFLTLFALMFVGMLLLILLEIAL